ncbi:hypothetical protein ACQ4PT_008718 [Festuca glaucescens]
MTTSPGDTLIDGGHLLAKLAAAALVAPALIWSSGLLPGTSNLYRRLLRGRRRHALPLPISHDAVESTRIAGEMPKSLAILEDVVQHTLSNLHTIHKSLQYWQSRAGATDSQLVYFMMFQGGPEAFVQATCQALTSLRSNGSPSEYLLDSASHMFATKVTALKRMQRCLAVFLSKVYSEVDTCRDKLTESSDQSLCTLIAALDFVFRELEDSFGNAGDGQIVATHDGNVPMRLFKSLPEVHVGSSDAVTESAISLIYENLQGLDSFVSSEISSHRKPRNITIYWLPYTFGAIGLSACSLWLLRHSSLMGSSDMDNWIHDAKESVARFWDVHVAKPTISTRDLLLGVFKRADKCGVRKLEAQSTAESLRRMLLAFSEQTLNEEQPQDASEQALMDTVMKRYEEELKHPVQNMFSGELARTMLIEIQKHRLDLQQSLVELDHIVKANRINLAMLAALPTFGLSLLLLIPVRALAVHDQGAERKGRIARRQRRLLLIQAEQKLMEFMRCKDNEMDEEACFNFGLAVYALDRLYNAVEFHARETGEWFRVREDIFQLAMPSTGMEHKKDVLSRLDSMYECLFPLQHL